MEQQKELQEKLDALNPASSKVKTLCDVHRALEEIARAFQNAKKPSGSQQTVMYISVLFAISDFTQQKREEDYQLIFDAATSSFCDSKEGEFYNVISNVKKQSIIVTKDFITKGEVRRNDIQGLECPVYRIKKAKGFDTNNMATIRTIVEKLK